MKTHGHDFSHWSDERHTRYNPIYKPWEIFLYDHFNWMFIELAAMLGNAILEVGASSGLGCLTIKSRYPQKQVVAMDVNSQCCKNMVARFKYWGVDIPVICCNGFNLPFSNNSFGVIFSVGVLEHYDKIDSVNLLKEQLRVARYVIVDVPVGVIKYGYGDERGWTEKEWINMANSVGKVIHVYIRTPSPQRTFGMVVEKKV